jgi:hypothetical protein
MAKKWYNYFVTVEGEHSGAEARPEAAGPAPAASAAQAVADIAASISVQPQFARKVSTVNTFEEIFAAAEINAPAHGYTVYKVADMLQSPHIRDLPREIRRSSVLVALEASGVKVQEVIEDAVRRDKALDTFEAVQRRSIDELEAKKREENAQTQAEADRVLAQLRARIQANNEEVAKEKARFQAWVDAKRKEEQKIAETVSYFVTENPVTVGEVAAPPAPAPKPA